jgi:DNA-binding IclR family transcriptional regulator
MEATPCHSTGVGKAALAFQDEAVIERIIRQGLERFTPTTIIEPERLRKELSCIRERGYATDEGEHEPNVRCVAAPIRNSASRVFAGISVSGPASRMTDARLAKLTPLVISHAEMISVRLGMPHTSVDA